MDNPTAERYNRLYQDSVHPFGKKPDFIVEDTLKYLSSGIILDLGAGDGRNSIYLASHGFQTHAIDFSSVAIEKIKEATQIKKIPLHMEIEDIRTWQFIQSYDAIIATFVLHHLSHSEVLTLIQKMMTHTKIGGLNIIAAFTEEGDFYKKYPQTQNFYIHGNELKALYAEWEILHYEKRNEPASAKRVDGSPMENVCAYLLARKVA